MSRWNDDDTPSTSRVVRRKKGEGRKPLDPQLEAFAASDDKRLRIRRPRRPRLRDPRPVAMVPGVANRDVRALLDERTEQLRGLKSDDPEFDRSLAEVVMLRLWRGRHLTSFATYAEDFLDLDPEAAQAGAERGAKALGRDLSALDDEVVAIWLRVAAAALEAEAPVWLRVDGERVVIELEQVSAPFVLHATGRKMMPLVQDRTPKPDDSGFTGTPRRREGPGSVKHGPRKSREPRSE